MAEDSEKRAFQNRQKVRDFMARWGDLKNPPLGHIDLMCDIVSPLIGLLYLTIHFKNFSDISARQDLVLFAKRILGYATPPGYLATDQRIADIAVISTLETLIALNENPHK